MIAERLRNRKMLVGLLFAAVCLKYLLYGFTYYPLLDDFIQYGGYPLYHDLGHVYCTIGTISSRPLAAVLDPLLWGQFWNGMSFALAVITVLHALSGFLFGKVLDNCGIRLSPLFYLIYLLFPLGSEATYWVSASTRIVVGMFLVSLSLYCLTEYCKRDKLVLLILYGILNLASFGFYEPVLVFGFVATAYILYLNRKRLKRRYLAVSVPVLSLVLMAGYYKLAAGIGAMGSRASGFSLSGLPERIADFLGQLFYILTVGTFNVVGKGCAEGFKLLLNGGVFSCVCLLFMLTVAILLGAYSYYHDSKKTNKWMFLGGLVLFFAPLVPNLLVSDVWLTYRSVFVSLVGLALMLEPVFAFVFRNRMVKSVVIGALALVFIAANFNEYSTFRRVSQQDVQLVQTVVSALDEEVLAGEKRAVVILQQEPSTQQVSYYKDHVKSVFGADWSLTGAVRAQSRNIGIKLVTPVLEGADYDAENAQVLYMDKYGRVTELE